ncbi:MAG: hypothetical protein M5R36_19715 [Deltaproteobacteria bacterium]|nr:hypothetical protein [Deltaproteobacteria bacterium]
MTVEFRQEAKNNSRRRKARQFFQRLTFCCLISAIFLSFAGCKSSHQEQHDKTDILYLNQHPENEALGTNSYSIGKIVENIKSCTSQKCVDDYIAGINSETKSTKVVNEMKAVIEGNPEDDANSDYFALQNSIYAIGILGGLNEYTYLKNYFEKYSGPLSGRRMGSFFMVLKVFSQFASGGHQKSFDYLKRCITESDALARDLKWDFSTFDTDRNKMAMSLRIDCVHYIGKSGNDEANEIVWNSLTRELTTKPLPTSDFIGNHLGALRDLRKYEYMINGKKHLVQQFPVNPRRQNTH